MKIFFKKVMQNNIDKKKVLIILLFALIYLISQVIYKLYISNMGYNDNYLFSAYLVFCVILWVVFIVLWGCLYEENSSLPQINDEIIEELMSSDMSDGNIEWLPEKNIIIYSSKVLAMLGSESGDIEVTWESFLSEIDLKDKANVCKVIAKQTREEKPFNLRFKFNTRNDGENIEVLARGKVDNYGPGATKRVLLSLYLLEESQANNSLIKDLLSIISYEIRTPLSSVIGSLSLIESEKLGKLPEKILPLVSISSKGCERIVFLLEEILDSSIIETTGYIAKVEPFEVSKIITKVIKEVEKEAGEKNINIKVVANISNVMAYMDPAGIEKVMTHLMLNGLKFSQPNKTLGIQIKVIDESVIFEVRNQGVVIPRELRGKIFDKFFQVDSDMTKEYGGAGLGLFISKNIIEAHDSKLLLVESSEIRTIFSFALKKATL